MTKNTPDTRMSPLSTTGYSYSHTSRLALTALKAGHTTFIKGHPGVGKSAMARELATSLGLSKNFHDIRISQREPADVMGCYMPCHKTGVMKLFPPHWVKSLCDKPGFLFLDEMNAATSRLMQACAYQICLEKRVGEYAFHPETRIMAAGNLADSGAIVADLSSALNNRLVHLTLKADVKEWLKWAKSSGQIASEIIGYFEKNTRTELLYNQDGHDAFPSPRSWAMASSLLQHSEPKDRKRLLAGCIGAKATEGFLKFYQLQSRISASDIVVNGQTINFTAGANKEPSFIHAIVDSVGTFCQSKRKWRPEWTPNLLQFLDSPGLDVEHKFILLRSLNGSSAQPLKHLRQDSGYRKLAGELVQLNAAVYQ